MSRHTRTCLDMSGTEANKTKKPNVEGFVVFRKD